MSELNVIPPMENEPEVVFKALTDRSLFEVKDEESGATVVEISGYDLNINFNMSFIRSVEEVESTVNGIAELCRKAIMSQLLSSGNEQKE